MAPKGANAAAVFTKNRFQAAPVVLSRRGLSKSGGRVHAVVVNAGCANAVTGAAGLAAARRVRSRAAELLALPARGDLRRLDGRHRRRPSGREDPRGAPGCRQAPLGLGRLDAASHAILTTDVGPKVAQALVRASPAGGAAIVGIAKGAGMIHPNMATMLAFVMTDVAATPAFLKTALREAADESFNAISVDGDTSTNDTVLLMASGAPREPEPRRRARPGNVPSRALTEVCRQLAWMIVRDGEGATRVMEITITGARSAREAKLAAHAVATSPLVKTALHGGDPNWGRILAAVGRSGARFSERKVSLSVGTSDRSSRKERSRSLPGERMRRASFEGEGPGDRGSRRGLRERLEAVVRSRARLRLAERGLPELRPGEAAAAAAGYGAGDAKRRAACASLIFSRIPCASFFQCPWQTIGCEPPVVSMMTSANRRPALMRTEAIWSIEIVSSSCPIHFGVWRTTRVGKTAICVGKIRLPDVQRDAAKTAASLVNGRLNIRTNPPQRSATTPRVIPTIARTFFISAAQDIPAN